MDKFFEGDTVELLVETDFDNLDVATTIEILVIKPSGDEDVWSATQADPDDYPTQENITDKYITYVTSATDLDEIGTYYFQSHVVWDTTKGLHGIIKKFAVIAHLGT
jgi:hypothetical protein